MDPAPAQRGAASFDNVYSVQSSSTYYYEVASCNGGGTSGLSAWVSKTTPTLVKPSVSTIVSATVAGTNQIVLMWTTAISSGQYVLQRATMPNGGYATIQTFDSGTTSYTDTLTAPSTVSTTYAYRIYSEVNGVDSDPSNVMQATLTVLVNNKTVQTGTLPTMATPANNIAQVYQYNGSTWTLDSAAQLQNVDWTDNKTVILTHGWDDWFGPSASGSFIQQFASTFWKSHPSGYNVLAVNWNDGDLPAGSDPDGAASFLANLVENDGNLVKVYEDAKQSAVNGVYAGAALADELVAAKMDPRQVMLIGHSNGAGFMASLAEEAYKDTGYQTQELAALDAPWATRSYWEVLAAASSVGRIDNYYTPLVQSTIDHLWDDDASPDFLTLGFGCPMLGAGNITNFELNHAFNINIVDGINGLASHTEIPLRYAATAASGSVWGFSKSDFMTSGASPYDGGLIWQENFAPGFFVPLFPSSSAIAAFTNSVQNLVSDALSGAWQYTKQGAVLLESALAGTATEVLTFGVDNAVTVTNEVVNTADIVEQSIAGRSARSATSPCRARITWRLAFTRLSSSRSIHWRTSLTSPQRVPFIVRSPPTCPKTPPISAST